MVFGPPLRVKIIEDNTTQYTLLARNRRASAGGSPDRGSGEAERRPIISSGPAVAAGRMIEDRRLCLSAPNDVAHLVGAVEPEVRQENAFDSGPTRQLYTRAWRLKVQIPSPDTGKATSGHFCGFAGYSIGRSWPPELIATYCDILPTAT